MIRGRSTARIQQRVRVLHDDGGLYLRDTQRDCIVERYFQTIITRVAQSGARVVDIQTVHAEWQVTGGVAALIVGSKG